MKKIICIFIILLLLTGCNKDVSIKKGIVMDERYKIIKVEFFGENEKKLDANGKIIGFGMYGNAEINKSENIKKMKVAYKTYSYIEKEMVTKMGTYKESQYMIINDLKEDNYEWIEFDSANCVILHMK